jgi:hypothetical protein
MSAAVFASAPGPGYMAASGVLFVGVVIKADLLVACFFSICRERERKRANAQ